MTHAFLERLELDHDCDERAIRRAYARELKKIDQETEAEAFHHLRASYEAALRWFQYRQMDDEDDEPEADPHADGLNDASGSVPAWSAADGQANRPDSAAGQKLPFDPQADAREAFEQFQQTFAELCRSDALAPEAVEAMLGEICTSERLLNTQAHHLFEMHCATLLARGWRTGHELLFPACVRRFEWDTDHTLSHRLGAPGWTIGLALEEHAFFRLANVSGYDWGQQDALWIIKRLRDQQHLGTYERLLLHETLVPVLRLYPNYLHIITNLPKIVHCSECWNQMPDDVQQQLRQRGYPAAALSPVEDDLPQEIWNGRWNLQPENMKHTFHPLGLGTPEPVPVVGLVARMRGLLFQNLLGVMVVTLLVALLCNVLFPRRDAYTPAAGHTATPIDWRDSEVQRMLPTSRPTLQSQESSTASGAGSHERWSPIEPLPANARTPDARHAPQQPAQAPVPPGTHN